MRKTIQSNQGQVLITVLVFMMIGITVTIAAVFLNLSSLTNTSRIQDGLRAYSVAESGAENAILRILRDPNYTGETVTMDNGVAEISVQGTDPKTITIIGASGRFKRTIEIQVTYTNNTLYIQSWKEI